MKRAWTVVFILATAFAGAQTQPGPFPPVATTKQLMIDMIHPASNDILVLIFRGGPQDEGEWAAVRRNALTLAESGNLLLRSGPSQGDWMKDTRLLVDAGTAAYKAAQANDTKALAAVAERLDASCTTCHKHYRPNMFPRERGSQ